MTEGPPYTRIAAVLRDRIRAGELAPGQRVPSTRELTREWGVAMATATKALAVLRSEGLVRAVPGVGTVVADVRRPPRRARSEPEQTLSPELIVSTAVAIADSEGLSAVSMRRVAADIGMATMSLYRHVGDKDDLQRRMVDAALGEEGFPEASTEGWRPRLELAARMLWAAFRRHPWLAGLMAVTRPEPAVNALRYSEWMIGSLEELGLDHQAVLDTYILLFVYVRGVAVNLEFEADAEADSGMDADQWMDTRLASMQAIIAGGGFPRMQKTMTTPFDLDLDALFETGLGYLLDGIATRIASA